MSQAALWPWVVLFLLGAYHGVNPGMGWLFAVALGMQEKSPKAVWRALGPITAGHALAIGLVVALAGVVQAALPGNVVKIGVAITLFALGAYRLFWHRHPRYGGMQVGAGDLTIWSFLMASAHGAGLMVLPVIFRLSGENMPGDAHAAMHHSHLAAMGGATSGLAAVGVHTVGYLVVTGLIAWAVYAKLGLRLLRQLWVNLDLIWAVALAATGAFVLLS